MRTSFRALPRPSPDVLGGALLLLAALAGLVAANSPWRAGYDALAATTIGPSRWHLDLTVATWATEGLLTLFFFVVGTELVTEMVHGQLRDPRRAAVPVLAAVGGMVVPALVYTAVVALDGDPLATAGWAVPTATDIAFALAVLAVFGRALPSAVRIFLLTLAVVDDLLGVLVIAVWFSDDVRPAPLALAAVAVAAFAVLARGHRPWLWLLVPLALVTWVALHAAGVPPAIGGALLGLAVPARAVHGETSPRAESIGRRLGPVSTLVALPVFAFFAAGVTIGSAGTATPVLVGVVAGLVLGKPVGVLLATTLVTRSTRLALPEGVAVRDLLPVGLLTGIGFTVSLLVAGLSFPDGVHADAARLGVLAGSLLSALGAALALAVDGRRRQGTGPTSTAARSSSVNGTSHPSSTT